MRLAKTRKVWTAVNIESPLPIPYQPPVWNNGG